MAPKSRSKAGGGKEEDVPKGKRKAMVAAYKMIKAKEADEESDDYSGESDASTVVQKPVTNKRPERPEDLVQINLYGLLANNGWEEWGPSQEVVSK